MNIQHMQTTQRLSSRTPKGWRRSAIPLTQKYLDFLNEALEPKAAKGAILEAALFRDGAGNARRIDALYENGWIVTWSCKGKSDDGVIEERATRLRFRITQQFS